jgi:hypothetical protein
MITEFLWENLENINLKDKEGDGRIKLLWILEPLKVGCDWNWLRVVVFGGSCN